MSTNYRQSCTCFVMLDLIVCRAMMILEDLKRLFALALKDQLSGQDSEEDTNYQAACSLVLKLQNVSKMFLSVFNSNVSL